MGNTPSDGKIVKVSNGNRIQTNHQSLLQPNGTRGPQGHVVQPRSPPVAAGSQNSRNRGFQEIELRDTSVSQSDTKNVPRHGPQGQMARQDTMLQRRVNERTEGHDTDFHHVIQQGQIEQQTQRREAQSDGEYEQPKYKDDDDLVLETYYHKTGKVFSCVYQSGQRFFLDSWQTQDWQPFPKHWYKEGILVTDRILKNDSPSNQGQSQRQQSKQQPHQRQQQQNAQNSNSTTEHNNYNLGLNKKNDREGYIDHPDLGRISTYIYEEKRNVHYFYDKESGSWVRLPISWEMRSEMVQRLMLAVEEALPEWTDYPDMLAALRGANYDPHDCIATYLTVQEKGPLSIPRNTDDAKLVEEKEEKIKKLQKKIDKMEKKIQKTIRALHDEQENRRAADQMVIELRDKVSTLEVEYSNAKAHVEAMQRDRPKTAPRGRATPQVEAVLKNPVESETVLSLSNTAKNLHKEYLQLKMEVEKRFIEFQPLMQQTMVHITKMRMIDGNQSAELEEMKELYRKEALQRKLLYNKLQEMRGNIRVFCRCRYDDRVRCCLEFPSEQEVHPPGAKKMKFDRVFTPQSTQNDVFEDTKPIISSCVDGYNVCIMAYGQTGSGKTHSMLGPPNDPGVNVRSVQELLRICNERENVDYLLKGSMVEIYNETIQDLLSNDVKVLELRTQGNKINLPGILEMDVTTAEDIQKIMDLGNKNRAVAATKMNSTSSRSHLIFMMSVEGQDRASGVVSTGTLTLCDLAGSERVGKSEATGKRLVEAAAINKSLTSLGQVFSALRTGQLHVPYRNSKLTHILQPCLGGDAKACLFVMVSPDEYNVTETISSLQFGSNARQVQLGEAKKNVRKGGPPRSMVT